MPKMMLELDAENRAPEEPQESPKGGGPAMEEAGYH